MQTTSRTRPRLSSTIRDELADRILAREMPAGSRLPPEPVLAAELGISRATLRDALRSLEDDGLLRRTRGAGTFITHRPRLRNNLDVNFGVTDAISTAGMDPGCENVRVTTAPATRDEGRRLALGSGEDVVVVERVRTADNRPVVFSRDVLASSIASRAMARFQHIGDASLYDILERELGIVVHHGVAGLQPVKADRSLANRLRVVRGALFMYLRQVDYDELGRPVLYSHEYHLADAFEFSVIRRGPGRRSG